MKTIFDKIDTKYLEHAAHGVECSTGTCGHASHGSNALLWVVIVALAAVTIKYYYGNKNEI